MSISSKIGIGTVQFGMDYGISNTEGMTPALEVEKILQTAFINDITIVDTAKAYGESERVIGACDLQRFRVVSKFMPSIKHDSIETQLLDSLKKMRINSLYGFLAHRPDELLENLDDWKVLCDLKAKKLVKKIGFSLNEPRELDMLLNEGLIPDLIQVPYNYFDNRFERYMKELHGNGCEIHTRSTFLQGLFFCKPEELSEYFDEIKITLSNLQKNYKTLGGELLMHILKKEYVDKVILGVENERQLIENLKSINFVKGLPILTERIPDDILIPSKWKND